MSNKKAICTKTAVMRPRAVVVQSIPYPTRITEPSFDAYGTVVGSVLQRVIVPLTYTDSNIGFNQITVESVALVGIAKTHNQPTESGIQFNTATVESVTVETVVQEHNQPTETGVQFGNVTVESVTLETIVIELDQTLETGIQFNQVTVEGVTLA